LSIAFCSRVGKTTFRFRLSSGSSLKVGLRRRIVEGIGVRRALHGRSHAKRTQALFGPGRCVPLDRNAKVRVMGAPCRAPSWARPTARSRRRRADRPLYAAFCARLSAALRPSLRVRLDRDHGFQSIAVAWT
jgi:hypothetical protein